MIRIQNIREKLKLELPGRTSHMKLAPFPARLDYIIPEDVHNAAVLILLYFKNDELHFPLITRHPHSPHDKHRGQIALPGGRTDTSDTNTWYTSVRECSEEIGVDRDYIELLGALTPIYIPVSHHHVYPYVGFSNQELKFTIQPEEIDAIHEIPLSTLLDQEIRKVQELITTDGPLRQVPTLQIENLVVWGATGMILEEFTDVIMSV
jgi:8-oxo-dGTP pyrophosphatase MutT (NUDIX family)